MRSSALAFFVFAGLTGLAAPANGQPSPSPAPARDCAALKAENARLTGIVSAMVDEIGAMEMAKTQFAEADKALGATQGDLAVKLEVVDGSIRIAQRILKSEDADDSAKRTARRQIMVLEKWASVLRDFMTRRALGEAVDPQDNALVKWKARIEKRLPKLRAALPGASEASSAARQAYLACMRGAASPSASPAPNGIRTYVTTIGEVQLAWRGASVRGTYGYGSTTRFANGVDPTGGNNVGRIEGDQADERISGYWEQPTGTVRCPTNRSGKAYWGRFLWTMKANGGWRGRRGYCDGDMNETWDGDPK